MKSELNQTLYAYDCKRDMIFKKYDRQISELVRLDLNIDILPEEKGHTFHDDNGKKRTECFYIDMSSTKFIVYNEDLKKCGYYDYNKELLNIYFLPLNKKVNLCKEKREIMKTKCVRINAKSQPKQDNIEALKITIAKCKKIEDDEDKSEEDYIEDYDEDERKEYYDGDQSTEDYDDYRALKCSDYNNK